MCGFARVQSGEVKFLTLMGVEARRSALGLGALEAWECVCACDFFFDKRAFSDLLSVNTISRSSRGMISLSLSRGLIVGFSVCHLPVSQCLKTDLGEGVGRVWQLEVVFKGMICVYRQNFKNCIPR